jgi:hypothetical protein
VNENAIPNDIEVYLGARLVMRRILVSALTIGISACASHEDAVRRSTETRVTAADCAAQSRKFDVASGQCVDIRPFQRVASIKPQSRAAPQLAPITNPAAPIEPHAIIDDSLKGETKLMSGMIALLRSRGYQCGAISFARPFSSSNGFRLTCDHARYRYEIEANKGNWDIRAK